VTNTSSCYTRLASCGGLCTSTNPVITLEYSLTLGSTNTVGNPNFYYLYNKPDLLVLVLYVDDLILTSSYEKPIALCSQQVRYEGHHPCTLLFGSPGLLGCK
jgi:hypothetical protein